MEPARPDLNGFKAIEANTCYDCGGTLKANDGTFSERPIESFKASFAAAICNDCKQRWLEEQEQLNRPYEPPRRRRLKQERPR